MSGCLDYFVMSVAVYLFVCFVCLSVCLLAQVENRILPNFTKILCMLLVALARSSFDGVVTRLVLPVLRMTSPFHTVGPMDHNQA